MSSKGVGEEVFYRVERRYAILSLLLAILVFLILALPLILISPLLESWQFALGLGIAIAVSVLSGVYSYFSRPMFERASVRVRLEILDDETPSDEEMKLIDVAKERGYVILDDVATELGLPPHRILEMLLRMEEEGRVRILGVEASRR